jgi:hypothetical protein
MSVDFGETPNASFDYEDPAGEKKDNTLWIIIAVVLVVLCCCCLLVGYGGWLLWTNGDEWFGLASQLGYLLL